MCLCIRPAVQPYHQQYLARGGRFGQPQDSTKGCTGTLCMYEWDVRAGVHACLWSSNSSCDGQNPAAARYNAHGTMGCILVMLTVL